MFLLVLVSLLWAFSFGLIKGRLAGLDSAFISVVRLGLAFLVFAPFIRVRGLSATTLAKLFVIGAVQFGVMYLAYNESFRHLPAYQVALFTVTTPILVTLFADALERQINQPALLAAVLAVVGAAVILYQGASFEGALRGFLLVQVSNAAFALGQIGYRRVLAPANAPQDLAVFGILYAGAFAVATGAMLFRADLSITLNASQAMTLLYLGLIASGLGFFLWNRGATRVDAGTLAVMNNAKIPLAVACSLLFFGESPDANLLRLTVSAGFFAAALWLTSNSAAKKN